MALSHDDVREILEIIDSSAPAEIQVETEGFSLHVVINDNGSGSVPAVPPRPTSKLAAPPPSPDSAPAGAESATEIEGLTTVESPMLGTFYRAEAPGEPAFVEVGSVVEPDTVLCIIEVMKMMNSVTAGVSGRIVEIGPANAQLVEFGEALFRVEAA
jgi:acetyl-CoA carboxylase biotin carboxyl carrier protein